MWDPGSRVRRARAPSGFGFGFTLLELLLVLAMLALAGSGVVLALRDQGQTRLEQEAQRLIALLESARAHSRASGVPVYWRPNAAGFEFTGLPPAKPADQDTDAGGVMAALPPVALWLAPDTVAGDGAALTLGPEPIIERQQFVLHNADHRLQIGTDGLRPFAVQAAAVDTPAQGGP